MTIKKALIALAALAVLFTACDSSADVVSRNLSVAAEQFEVDRRVVFYNGITDTYMLTIEGRCSIEADTEDRQLEVTCKVDDSNYKKHYLGLSDNVTYFAEQLEDVDASEYRYRVIFKPSTILPDIDPDLGNG